MFGHGATSDSTTIPGYLQSFFDISEEKYELEIINALSKTIDIPNATINSIDGIRIEYENFWGLIRASNTSPVLVLRFEADNLDDLVKVQRLLLHLIKEVAPELTFDVFEGP